MRWAAPSSAATPSRAKPGRLLSNHFLLQLERVSFVSRRVHVGRVKGERRSPRHGSSVEFADHRPYGVGDDLRYVDWNVFGRHNRLYLKLFVDEQDLCVHLLLDGSASMGFGSPSKFEVGVRLAAALAFVAFSDHERVGLAVFRDRVSEGRLPTRGRRQFLAFEEFLAGLRPEGPTRFSDALAQYARQTRGAGLAVVVSDFLDPAGYERGLRALLERGFDVHVVHLLAPEELEPTLAGDLELVDAESGEVREVSVDGEALRAYGRELAAFLAGIAGFCRDQELDYVRVSTAVPLEDLVLRRLKGSLLE